MGFLANRRIAGWTEGLKQWALKEEKLHGPGTPEADYSLGVIMAVMDAQYPEHRRSPVEVAKLPLQERTGYSNSSELINKVLRSGDAPTGSYQELLRSQPRPAQVIWNQATTDLYAAYQIIYTIPERPNQSDAEKSAEFEFVVGKLMPAMYSFEELVERESQLELTRPMAAGTRDLLEGIMNNDANRIEQGLDSVRQVVTSIFEPATDGQVQQAAPSVPKRDWPSVEFDQERNLWVCAGHRDSTCRECPGAFEILGPRNKARLA